MEPFIHASPEINVEEIMDAIRKKIQDKKDSGLLKQSEIDEIDEMELQPLPDFLEIPNIYDPVLYPGFSEHMAPPVPLEESLKETGLVKGILKKIRSLLSPWIRFMTRPMYIELKTGILDLQKKVPDRTAEQRIHPPAAQRHAQYDRRSIKAENRRGTSENQDQDPGGQDRIPGKPGAGPGKETAVLNASPSIFNLLFLRRCHRQ